MPLSSFFLSFFLVGKVVKMAPARRQRLLDSGSLQQLANAGSLGGGASVHAGDTWVMRVDDDHVWQYSVSRSAYMAARAAVASYRALKRRLRRRADQARIPPTLHAMRWITYLL